MGRKGRREDEESAPGRRFGETRMAMFVLAWLFS